MTEGRELTTSSRTVRTLVKIPDLRENHIESAKSQ